MKTHPISMPEPPASTKPKAKPGETWLVRFSGERYSTPLHVLEILRYSDRGRAVLMMVAGMDGFAEPPRWFLVEETDFIEELPQEAIRPEPNDHLELS